MRKEETFKGYVPPGAAANFDNNSLPPPVVEYDERMAVLNIEEVKKIVKGDYGKEEERE